MTINGNFPDKSPKNSLIDVAIGVLSFGRQLLLATRLPHQHQGGKLEFIGGKIDSGETPIQALIRETKEEIGLDIGDNVCTKLGRICHDYTDKSVCLHVYQVWLSEDQYRVYQNKQIGHDGQAIGFYDKEWVLTQADNFPAANRQILYWLSLPSVVVISRSLADFGDSVADFVKTYANLPMGSTLYLRVHADFVKTKEVIKALSVRRADLAWVLPFDFYCACQSWLSDVKIVALKLPKDDAQHFLQSFEHHQIKSNADKTFVASQDVVARYLQMSMTPVDVFDFDKLFALPWALSGHDTDEIHLANALAGYYPIWGVFVSPVLPTNTHPDALALGWKNFAKLASIADVPVIALGGLSKHDLPKAYQHGAVAVSGIRSFI